MSEPDQEQKSTGDSSDNTISDAHVGAADPLEQNSQASSRGRVSGLMRIYYNHNTGRTRRRSVLVSSMPLPSRRALYRIVYPLSERPTLELGQSLHDVVDCSERGVRYELNHQKIPAIGAHAEGVLHFPRGVSVRVEGTILRAMRGVVVLALAPPLPFGEIIAEQRYLRSKGYLLPD